MAFVNVISMEARVQTKVNKYCCDFRRSFLTEIDALLPGINDQTLVDQLNELKMKCTFMPYPEVRKGEFKRKKRLQNMVPESELCTALCSGGVRCSRRRQSVGLPFCGTHVKGQPNGSMGSPSQGNMESELVDGGHEKMAYPVNENGIIKIYKDSGRKELLNVNQIMKSRI